MFLDKLSTGINRTVEYLLFGMGLGMTLLVAAQVLLRYVFNHSIFWSEELSRFLLVWLTFLGASVVYYRGAHACVDFLYTRFGPQSRRAMNIVVYLGLPGPVRGDDYLRLAVRLFRALADLARPVPCPSGCPTPSSP